jgi:hypothetical protein
LAGYCRLQSQNSYEDINTVQEIKQRLNSLIELGSRTETPDFSDVITWKTCSIVLPAYNAQNTPLDRKPTILQERKIAW